jgi:pimeloyl-ACP methyl ester carboxylesterase
MDVLGVSWADFVTHDIGNMVGCAFAAGYPDRMTRFVPIDASLPGVEPWEQIVQDPRMWQFGWRKAIDKRLDRPLSLCC